MQFTWSELVSRARSYIDDDHDETPGWLSESRWLELAFVEYSQLYRRWIRTGLVTPAPADQTFSGTHTVTVTGVLAVVGVAEDLGSGMLRVLTPAASAFGANPLRSHFSGTPGTHWTATGTADAVTVNLEPRPTSGTYFVRYIATPVAPGALSNTIDLPYGTDERLVLGIARRAKVKEGGASQVIERLIFEADGELNFAAFAKQNDAPRVRRVRDTAHQSFPAPSLYRYY